MAVSRSLRFQILRRDDHRCRYCGAAAPEVKLTVDHVLPETLGGTDDPANLVTACEGCNGGKSATPPDAARVAEVSQDALRWAAAVRHAADAMLLEHRARANDQDEFERRWNSWTYEHRGERRTVDLPANWRSTVDRLRAAGLPLDILLSCIEVAMSRRGVGSEFNYMCGVAWKKIGALQDAARSQLDGQRAAAPADDDDRDFELWRWQEMVARLVSLAPEADVKHCRDEAMSDIYNADEQATEDRVLYHTARWLTQRFVKQSDV